MKGKFITFEGCERVGKSTYVNMLREYLLTAGKADNFIFTREPGGGIISERIREVILDKAYLGKMSYHTEALLYAAARCQHIDDVIMPALTSGKNVVCDRYIHSSYAYQAYARSLGIDFVKSINDYAEKYCMPDAVIFIDLSPDKAYERETNADDRMENENSEFHAKVYEGFKELSKTKKSFIRIIPKSKEETFSTILKAISGIVAV
ncbi:MAG: dTMP kinase [Clostridiales bacterium]|jgi:dTMP kinase|nr:dTMP kinase [Clostridiales bacterium]